MRIAIYTTDVYYLDRVCKVMNERYSDEFELCKINQKDIERVLNSDEFNFCILPDKDNSNNKAVYSGTKPVLFLCEENNQVPDALFKYQSVTDMKNKIIKFNTYLEELKATEELRKQQEEKAAEELRMQQEAKAAEELKYWKEETIQLDKENQNRHKPINMKVFSFMSLQGGMGSSTVAGGSAMHFSRIGEKVLYINLKPFGGSGYLEVADDTTSIIDFVNETKEETKEETNKFDSLIKKININTSKVNIINGFKKVEDMNKLSSDDLYDILEKIDSTNKYSMVIFDISMSGYKFLDAVIEASKTIMFVLDISNNASVKVSQAMNYIENSYTGKNIKLVYNKYHAMPVIPKNLEKMVIGGISFNDSSDVKEIMNKISNMRFIDAINR